MSLKELKKVTEILGTILTKDEVDEFMKEADKVKLTDCIQYFQNLNSIPTICRMEMGRWT